MVRVLLSLLRSYQSGSSRTVVTVCDIQCRHGGKCLSDGVNVFLLVDDPQGMTEAVTRCDEIIFRLFGCIFRYDGIQFRIVRIGEEYRFDVGVVYADMLHAVFFLVTAGQFVLLDDTVHVVRNIRTDYETVLSLAVHGLGIDIIVFLFILYEPSLVLEHLEMFCGAFINARIVFVSSFREIDFRLDDMVQ